MPDQPLLQRALRLVRRAAAHPATAGRALDDAQTVARRRVILEQKRFLRAIYDEWYRALVDALPPVPGPLVELGSGAGFLRAHLPAALTSDVLAGPGLSAVLDARQLPFATGKLRALLLLNVLHHLPDAAALLGEAERCLRPGGALLLVEPWLTPWSRPVYALLQDEPCRPDAAWHFTSRGPLSDSNLALPWILFQRDRAELARRFPRLALDALRPTMPLSYLLSGGIATRLGLPGWSYRPWRWLERRCARLDRGLAMFAVIRLRRL